MAILTINTGFTGQQGVAPRRIQLVTTDNYATITAANYLNNNNLAPNEIYPTDIIDCLYSYNVSTQVGTYAQFTPSFSNGIITLQDSGGGVVLPVVNNDFAVFSGTSGTIKDAGYLPSDPAKTRVVMAGSAVVANHIALFQDTTGTIDDTAATAINNGPIQAGVSGTSGYLASFPATASKGSLRVVAADNAGDTVTQITNASFGQATVLTIPDPVAATANMVVAPAALVSGNLVKASGTAGLVIDAGFAVKANTTAAYAGGGTSNAFTATGLTTSSIVTASILTQTNAASIVKVVPTANTLTVTFSADPGANTTVSWIAITPAV